MKPPTWTTKQLHADRKKAIGIFRNQRLGEDPKNYSGIFDEISDTYRRLFVASSDLRKLADSAPKVTTNKEFLEALRYLAGPPVSADDLKILADVPSLSPSSLQRDKDLAKRVVTTVNVALDKKRFPWLVQDRDPTEEERDSGARASAALVASARILSSRRNEAKKEQEQSVKNALTGIGLMEVPRRTISNLRDAPGPGEFCPESMLGRAKADLVIGLWDNRVMALECKVSNSYVNSIKRLNREATGKAVNWLSRFGQDQVVPGAVISGVFDLPSLLLAQDELAIFWAHDLKALTDWVKATKKKN